MAACLVGGGVVVAAWGGIAVLAEAAGEEVRGEAAQRLREAHGEAAADAENPRAEVREGGSEESEVEPEAGGGGEEEPPVP